MVYLLIDGERYKAKLINSPTYSVDNFKTIRDKTKKDIDFITYSDPESLTVRVRGNDHKGMTLMVNDVKTGDTIDVIVKARGKGRKKSRKETDTSEHKQNQGIVYGPGQYKDLMGKLCLYESFKRSKNQLAVLLNNSDTVNALNPSMFLCPVGGCCVKINSGQLTALIKHLPGHDNVQSRNLLQR